MDLQDKRFRNDTKNLGGRNTENPALGLGGSKASVKADDFYKLNKKSFRHFFCEGQR